MKKKISETTASMRDILAPHRSIVYDAITDIMLEALTEVCDFLKVEEAENDEGWAFDRSVCGFKPAQLSGVYAHGKDGDLVSWVAELPEVERMGLLMAFLDWDRVRMLDFRTRYPNSFMRWEQADDESLLEMYASKPSWSTLSRHFGRNVNAIKLRLQHLGVDLGSEAGRSRYPRSIGVATDGAVQVASE
jgi:hypothetical protein